MPWKPADNFWAIALALGAVRIWMRDRAWQGSLDEAVPLLAALPLAVWLGAPWRFAPAGPIRPGWLVSATACLIAGGLTGLNLPWALAWTLLLAAWLESRLAPEQRVGLRRLLPMGMLAFPWLSSDLPQLGWWFRLSASWTAEHLFHGLGLDVQRLGTQLSVAGMPFDVSPACSGLKGLQAMLIAGTALCFLQAGRTRRYWPCLATLPLLAWLANTVRVILLVAAGLSAGPEFASGWFHPVAGWLVLGAIFAAGWLALERCGSLRPRGGIAG